MRKFTSLIALLVIASFAMAQTQLFIERKMEANPEVIKSLSITKEAILQAKQNAEALRTKEDVYFSVTFEEDDPIWTFGQEVDPENTMDMPNWQVTDQDGAPETWVADGGYYFEFLGEYSLTGNEVDGKWAWIDVVSPLLPGGDANLAEIGAAWIQFDNIDLTGVTTPMVYFMQLHRAFNPHLHATFVDVSIDGGDTWEEFEVNTSTEHAEYDDLEKTVPILMAADEANVSIRFRYWMDRNAQGTVYPAGYGWQIDDIMIIDIPLNDLRVTDARMNFFDYIDYTAEGMLDYYHFSSHYGQIPADQYDAPFALSWFNVAIMNNGLETVTPSVNITIHDPEMNVVFDETVVGSPLAHTQTDTIDVIEVDFALGADPAIGEYIVTYEVFAEGVEDENPASNVTTANFFVTDCTMSRDAQEITGVTGPEIWVGGGNDGDMIATDFLYLFEDEIHSLDVYISAQSTAGASFIARIMEFDSGSSSWVDITTSPLTMVEEEHLGDWVTVTFIDPAIIQFSGDDDYKQIRAAIEFYYGDEENSLRIGVDRSNNHSFWAASWFFTDGANANQWFSIPNWTGAGLLIRLNTTCPEEDNFVEGIEDHNISIYPNPTAGTLNIDNVKGANIEIINLMGQTIEAVYNANEFNTVDMSKYANGTYIVRIVKDGSVITHKINLID